MDSFKDLDSARRAVGELCGEQTEGMAAGELLAVLDAHITEARRGGDALATNVLMTVRRGLRSRAETLN